MLLSDFDYDLPEDFIAQKPIEPRDHSKLMILKAATGALTHNHFYNLPDYLQPGDTLVFNDTRVIPARLIGSKAGTGGKVEVFLLNRISGDEWEALVKPGKKARPGTIVEFGEKLKCEVISTTDFGGRIIKFHYNGIFEAILDQLGETPLPPYIKEQLRDKERYQTIYARERGSAAAPTAGLHFTSTLMDTLKTKGINFAFITLHVGLGTFRPVSTDDITQHVMHREYYSISQQAADIINATKKRGNKVVAVGTTSIRTLESASKEGLVEPQSGWTDIFIYPGYRFKVIDAIITNFHLPKSTLLMLISAFAGKEHVLKAYKEAIEHRYRFFSFGDAMFIY
ncbi:MAG: tRNA preQ1(34) S-adenosylmethionine ribosyltransferase-isomerase QueA [Veillonellaceae bacterium]|jgi:S-adenosylmethionine:tRNA ribosyltransferase-isomerase|nr:tRNA preQ1(34) S-adenosylmethionine ribosyltransferase-isomerase QueA [Veillonellaceae bacterium]